MPTDYLQNALNTIEKLEYDSRVNKQILHQYGKVIIDELKNRELMK